MPRKDRVITPSVTRKIQDLGYDVADWDDSQTLSKIDLNIKKVLEKSSKQNNQKPGYPDRIYFNHNKKLLILVEEKPNVNDHDKQDITKGTVAGIKHYLQQFINNKSDFDGYKIIGIAVSGNLDDPDEFMFDCFKIEEDAIKLVKEITNFVSEEKFLAIFDRFDEEEVIEKISKSSQIINNLLRSVDSQQRPIILSLLMIFLYKPKNCQDVLIIDYKKQSNGKAILSILMHSIESILKSQNVPEEKIKFIQTQIELFKHHHELTKTNILIKILEELEKNVISLFNSSFITLSNYDIIGKFYDEFLKYAGISNVKKGIVLTPRHIATLFTKLVDIKANDVILDLCCGTGAFLIAGMNKLISIIQTSDLMDKEKRINQIKENQLLGFEINPTMYICSICSMFFRGDGKSKIYNMSSIKNKEADRIINEAKPTIGFINPPFSGKESTKDPTPKEITFLKKMLNSCSRYGIIIAPLSMYFSNKKERSAILKNHTLVSVINMSSDLFLPNAATYTAIAVFKTHKPHDFDKEVKFYDFSDDGLIMTKKGRMDLKDQYSKKEQELLDFLNDKEYDVDLVKKIKTKIKRHDEWNVHAHTKTNYKHLNPKAFQKTIKDYVIFKTKKQFNLAHHELDDLQLIELMVNANKNQDLLKYFEVSSDPLDTKSIDTGEWQEFNIKKVFSVIEKTKIKSTKNLTEGDDVYYVGAKKTNNGVISKVAYSENKISKGNCIIFINGGDGSGGYSLYFEDDFIGGSFNSIGRHDRLNVYTGLFLVTMLDQQRYKFSYGRTWNSDRFNETTILLPVNEKKEIDWEFMESFIKQFSIAKLL